MISKENFMVMVVAGSLALIAVTCALIISVIQFVANDDPWYLLTMLVVAGLVVYPCCKIVKAIRELTSQRKGGVDELESNA